MEAISKFIFEIESWSVVIGGIIAWLGVWGKNKYDNHTGKCRRAPDNGKRAEYLTTADSESIKAHNDKRYYELRDALKIMADVQNENSKHIAVLLERTKDKTN
ncbi:MAG: hypothetical protein ACR2PR_09215 [Pseudohongiellaceae bacterium]